MSAGFLFSSITPSLPLCRRRNGRGARRTVCPTVRIACAALLSAGAAHAGPTSPLAAEGRARDRSSGSPSPTESRSYAQPLGVAYVAAPLLSLGGAALASEGHTAAIVTLAALGPLAPASVHWSYGEVGRGFVALGMQVGSAAAGGLIGAQVGASLCDENAGEEIDCMGTTLGGMFIGGAALYATWAFVDVSFFSEEPARRHAPLARDHRAVIRPYASPLVAEAQQEESLLDSVAAERTGPLGSLELVGVELGVGADF